MQNKHKRKTRQSKHGSRNRFWDDRKNLNYIYKSWIYYHELCHINFCQSGVWKFRFCFLRVLIQKNDGESEPIWTNKQTYFSDAWKDSPGFFIDHGPRRLSPQPAPPEAPRNVSQKKALLPGRKCFFCKVVLDGLSGASVSAWTFWCGDSSKIKKPRSWNG